MKVPENLNCPVCTKPASGHWATAKDVEYFSTADEYHYYSCANCMTVFISPVPENELHKIYPQNYYSFLQRRKNWAFQIKEWLDKRLFKKILSTLKTDQLRVLDVGGGTGWLCDVVRKIDNRIILTQIVDIDSKAKKTAIENGHAYFEGRIEDFVTESEFDLVFLLNLIEHVANPVDVLQKIEKMLAPGGKILIKTPNIDSLDARLFRKKYWGGLHCPRHWIIFSETSFKKIIEKTNLRIERLQYTQGGPFWAFSLIAWLWKKEILKTSSQNPIIFHSLFPVISAVFAGFDFLRKPFAKTSQMFIILKKK